jgi:hypothetical protein
VGWRLSLRPRATSDHAAAADRDGVPLHRLPDHVRERVLANVRPTMLDHHAWFRPYIESYTSEKLAWAVTGAVHSFEGFADPSRYPALIAEYASRGARPS